MPGCTHERTALSLDLGRRIAGDAKDGALSPEVRVRGGAGQHWAGKFEWLTTSKGLKKTTLDRNELAGSLVDRPSALDGSQTGYSSRPDVSRRSPPSTDRKWGALPPLPAGEGGNEANDESFNTEELLASLRPERLSLYHIATPVRSTAGLAISRDAATATTDWPSQTVPTSTRGPPNHDAVAAPDNYSIPTRDWDLHSCNTTELCIDTQLRRQENFARHPLPQEQRDQLNVRNDNEAVYGLPEEDATNPESWFYAEMIEIVNDYHEQLQNVVQRAFEAGQISAEQWMREKWTNRVALDRKLRIAEVMSGYKVQESS